MTRSFAPSRQVLSSNRHLGTSLGILIVGRWSLLIVAWARTAALTNVALQLPLRALGGLHSRPRLDSRWAHGDEYCLQTSRCSRAGAANGRELRDLLTIAGAIAQDLAAVTSPVWIRNPVAPSLVFRFVGGFVVSALWYLARLSLWPSLLVAELMAGLLRVGLSLCLVPGTPRVFSCLPASGAP